MTYNDAFARIARGAAAGFVGTLALQVLRTGSQRMLPGTMPPMRQDPGEYMVQRAESLLPDRVERRIPGLVETAAARSVAAGYGLTAGVAYAALRREGGDVLSDGALLGLGTWAAGYLGWLPALGLMPPLTQQDAPEALGPVARHLVFGVVTVAAYGWLTRNAS